MDIAPFRPMLPPDRFEDFERGTAEARELLDGRVIWNINSTARGGGVVELLGPLLAYARGVGVDARWVVIDGPPEFFELTKRIHNRLHGAKGDGGPLGPEVARTYERVLEENMDRVPRGRPPRRCGHRSRPAAGGNGGGVPRQRRGGDLALPCGGG